MKLLGIAALCAAGFIASSANAAVYTYEYQGLPFDHHQIRTGEVLSCDDPRVTYSLCGWDPVTAAFRIYEDQLPNGSLSDAFIRLIADNTSSAHGADCEEYHDPSCYISYQIYSGASDVTNRTLLEMGEIEYTEWLDTPWDAPLRLGFIDFWGSAKTALQYSRELGGMSIAFDIDGDLLFARGFEANGGDNDMSFGGAYDSFVNGTRTSGPGTWTLTEVTGVTEVPLPPSISFLAVALAGLGLRRRR